MPSPFPGMDPYLENPAGWPGVHGKLIHGAADLLSDQVLPRYVVRPDLRVYTSDQSDPGRKVLIPDLRISLGRSRGRTKTPRRPAGGRSAVAVAEPVEATMPIEEVAEPRLLIRSAVTRQVVTVIEILSPANKLSAARGRDNYLGKRREVMASGSHFVEIDLLRAGARFGPDEELPPYEYLINVSRAERRPKVTVWPVRLDQRLPTIPIPLLPTDPDAHLDLQGLLTAIYDRSGYAIDVDYTKDPVPPLPPKWRGWAKKLLAGKRRR